MEIDPDPWNSSIAGVESKEREMNACLCSAKENYTSFIFLIKSSKPKWKQKYLTNEN